MVDLIVTSDHTNTRREHTLTRLLQRGERLHRRGTQASTRFSRWRGVLFLVGLLITVTLYRLEQYDAGNWSLLLFVIGFLTIAAYHNRLEHRIHRLALWSGIKRQHLGRLRLDWNAIPPNRPVQSAIHLYAHDLDLLGPRSLLHLLDTTTSTQGHDRLASWLLTQPPDEQTWQSRHRLVKELTRLTGFRDRLNVQARLTGEAEINGQRIEAILRHHLHLPSLRIVLPIQAILAATTLILGLGTLLNLMPSYWMISFGLYAVIFFQTDQGEELLEHAVGLHHEVEKLGTLLQFLEQRAQKPGSALAATCRVLLETDKAPSALIRRLAWVLHGVSVKAHPLVHLVLNALCPWDLFFTFRLQQFQRRIQHLLPLWLDCLAEVEAASALATFAYLHPSYTWPTPHRTEALTATGLGHPLIPAGKRVTNDIAFARRGILYLITGSNMSGKSTFLRTIGINLCLAQAGAPVCAKTFAWTWSRLACCIRVNDSLDAGLSFFYAEVKRLKSILQATEDREAPPVLFLIDEIFKGTNNRERLIGSRAYVRALAMGNGYGLVTTHDLELADLDQSIPALTNSHFQETVAAGTLQFDYTLRPGPCPTTNALRIMELEGLPINLPPPS
ncbi:MutS family DNA mismatch repair protein [Nitrospira lenta]|uniref:Putative DNA mismatch repair protein, MutS family n=1 Tax=Nitrospira lenta TaxID=1436998 RepID=A0A330L1K7_9BACT|nr:MutS family DNA mismatch repair protein [Nitrospira lenta]SPP63217.1 putative DNA mismatch repair protein, MutS family [Nitrospira lenta]